MDQSVTKLNMFYMHFPLNDVGMKIISSLSGTFDDSDMNIHLKHDCCLFYHLFYCSFLHLPLAISASESIQLNTLLTASLQRICINLYIF